jgi:uncharacterized surface protein with fasciclin (FAS1) repeats
LRKHENNGALTTILTCHEVADKWNAATIRKMTMKGKDMANIKTASGGTLVAKFKDS